MLSNFPRRGIPFALKPKPQLIYSHRCQFSSKSGTWDKDSQHAKDNSSKNSVNHETIVCDTVL